MIVGRLRHLAAAAVVLTAVLAPVVPATRVPQHAAPVAALRTARAATADGPFELTSTLDPAKPVRWLACKPIEYRINPTDMPAGMTATVQHAMGVLAKQTGVRFRYAGRTTHAFGSTSHADTPTIYLAFTSKTRVAGQTFGGASGQVGVGGPAAAWYRGEGRTVEAVTYGRVLLSARFHGDRTGAGATWQSLILHEVGHALNLAHRGGPDALMHPSLTDESPGRFTPAEVRALRKVLQTSGCDYAAWSRL